MGLKELFKMYKICILTAFLSQPDFQYCGASVRCSGLVDLEGEIVGKQSLAAAVKESAWEGGQVNDHHTAPVPGSLGFPWQIIPSFQ